MKNAKKLLNKLFKKESVVEKKDLWRPYLEQKIGHNKALIKELENKINYYKKRKLDNLENDYTNYEKEIKSIEESIKLLSAEIEGWNEEICSGNFKGYY